MTADINYKEKPSAEMLKNYKQKLENFLSAHKASVTIELWDEPLRLESRINGNLDSTDYHWIKEIKVSTPEMNGLSVTVMSEGIDERTDDKVIWHDAYSIQDQIYKQLGLIPELPPSTSNDPYWNLWRYLE